jgi:hypothetical protein
MLLWAFAKLGERPVALLDAVAAELQARLQVGISLTAAVYSCPAACPVVDVVDRLQISILPDDDGVVVGIVCVTAWGVGGGCGRR